jgi:hypothetical protein|tara:strand:- start:1912 stop:2385 length:474 start_codon:yes stop_codon:yes gene_type:complete
MENLISHLEGPNKRIINLIKLDSGEVVNSTSKWLSDRWFLRETNFAKDLTCVEISPFKNTKDSNVFVGAKYLGHKVYKSLSSVPLSIDFLSILDPDIALETLESIDFSKYTIKYFCIAINPVKTKDFKQNKKNIELFMKDKANFIKQNRTELLYSVI